MLSRRESHEKHKGDNSSGQTTTSGLLNVMKEAWTNEPELYIEHFFRRVVREELERKFRDQRATVNEAGTSRATPLELRFLNQLPDTISTHLNIRADDKKRIQIALFDVRSQSVVKSSMKIELCVLDGDFGFNGSEDWTQGEFNANILLPREGKRPLLNGERFITLNNGVGCVNNLSFTDNSRWVRSRKFRFGAKVVQPISSEANIKEARSEPFKVKEYRGESTKKHYPPSLNDEVWRLEQIAKGRKIHNELSRDRVHTVGDLLRLHTTNPSFEVGKISKNSWEKIIRHAKTCVIEDDKRYVYHIAEEPIGLFFNSIYVLVGATFDGQNYRSLDTLTPNEKNLVEILKQRAYQDVDNIKPIDETSSSCLGQLACLGAGQSDATEPYLQQFNISTAQEGAWLGSGQPYASTSYDGVHNYQTYVDPLPGTREMTLNNEMVDGNFSDLGFEGDSCPHNGSCFPVMQDGNSTVNDGPHIQFTNCCPPYTAWGQENGFYNTRTDFCHSHFFNSTLNMSSKGKPKTLWHKIRSALKCVISVRNDAAAKRNAKLLNYNNY